MLLKDKYKPKQLEDLHYYTCYNILQTLKDKSKFAILLYGKYNIGKTLILNILKSVFMKDKVVYTIDNYTTKDNILLIDDLDLLTDKEQFKIKQYLDLGGSFIATLNNLHKIIKDVIIRCMVLELSVNTQYYKTYLNYIIDQENIVLHKITVDDILQQSGYNIAIAINYIQKMSIIKSEHHMHINNLMWDKYYTLCLTKDNEQLQKLLNSVIEKEYSFLDLLHSFLNYIKLNDKLNDNIRYKIIKLTLHYIPVYNNLQNNTIMLYIFTNRLINLLN